MLRTRLFVAAVLTLSFASGWIVAVPIGPGLTTGALQQGTISTTSVGRGGDLVVTTGGGPQGPAGQTEGTGAISGVAVDLTTGRPLPGVMVTLIAPGRRGLAPRQITDEKGRFIFPRLPASDSYQLSATRNGYADSGNQPRIVLADGQWFADAKIALPRLGSIGGTLTDEAGEPVVGAWVRVLAQVMIAGAPQLAAGTAVKTDDRGVYRIAGLAPGKYLAHVPSIQWSAPEGTSQAALNGMTADMYAAAESRGVSLRRNQVLSPDGKTVLVLGGGATPPPASDGHPLAYPTVLYPAARSPSEAAVIDLGRGEEKSGIDIQMRPAATVRVSGLIDAAGSEIAGILARLLPAGMEGLANGAEAATAPVASDGTFTFLNVSPGNYTIVVSSSEAEFRVSSPGFGSQSELPVAAGWRSMGSGGGAIDSGPRATEYSYRNSAVSSPYTGRASITVGTNDLSGVVMTLRKGVSVSGHVVYESGAPQSGLPPNMTLPVFVEPANGDMTLGLPTGRLSQADGTFSIEGVQPGQYVLRFVSIGSSRMKSVVMDGKEYAGKPLDVAAGHDLTGIVVTMTDKVAKLDGIARDERGQPLTHGTVLTFPAERDQWVGYGFSPVRIRMAAVGTNGSYQYPSIYPGDYYVIAVDEAFERAWQDPKFLEAAAALASRVSLDWGESKKLDVSLQRVPGFRAPGGRP